MGTPEALTALRARTLGPADVRLVPKASGMRPIVNLSHAASVRPRRGAPATAALTFPAVNRALEPVLAVLKSAMLAHDLATGVCCDAPDTGGDRGARAVATPSLDAVYTQLKRFKAAWRAAGEPPVTALAFDVHRAFDTVCTHPAKPTELSIHFAVQSCDRRCSAR